MACFIRGMETKLQSRCIEPDCSMCICSCVCILASRGCVQLYTKVINSLECFLHIFCSIAPVQRCHDISLLFLLLSVFCLRRNRVLSGVGDEQAKGCSIRYQGLARELNLFFFSLFLFLSFLSSMLTRDISPFGMTISRIPSVAAF